MKRLIRLFALVLSFTTVIAVVPFDHADRAWGRTHTAAPAVRTGDSGPGATTGQGGKAHDPDEAALREKRESAQRQLELAKIYVKAGTWDRAIESYSKAADSDDPAVASKARKGLLDALNAKEDEALGPRAILPPPVNRWWVLDYIFYGLVAILLARILVPFASALIRRLFKREPSNSSWRVSVSGSAEEPGRSLVFDEFVVTMRGLRETGQPVGALSSVGLAQARFFTPISLADILGPDLVVRGIDVSRIAAIAQRFIDYFSYSFELRVDKLGAYAYAYASLRWGGRVEESWQIPALAEETQFSFRQIGRQLAFAVYGDKLVRR